MSASPGSSASPGAGSENASLGAPPARNPKANAAKKQSGKEAIQLSEEAKRFLVEEERRYGRSTEVGNFRLYKDRPLGRGQFGTVYRGTSLQSLEPVAIKMIQVHRDDLPRVLREVRELFHLQRRHHSCVIRLFDQFIKEKGNLCIVMLVTEYCAGGDLREYLQTHGALSEANAKRLVAQIVDCLSAVHRDRIMHRDLKPANIMLTSRNINVADVRLVDWGMARSAADRNRLHRGDRSAGGEGSATTDSRTSVSIDIFQSAIGTPAYMAPERLGYQAYDFRAEVWAVGVVMYELLHACYPYPEGRTPMELLSTVKKPVKFPRKDPPLSADCISLMVQMLDPVASKRPTMAEIKASPWFRGVFPLPSTEGAKREGNAGVSAPSTETPGSERHLNGEPGVTDADISSTQESNDTEKKRDASNETGSSGKCAAESTEQQVEHAEPKIPGAKREMKLTIPPAYEKHSSQPRREREDIGGEPSNEERSQPAAPGLKPRTPSVSVPQSQGVPPSSVAPSVEESQPNVPSPSTGRSSMRSRSAQSGPASQHPSPYLAAVDSSQLLPSHGGVVISPTAALPPSTTSMLGSPHEVVCIAPSFFEIVRDFATVILSVAEDERADVCRHGVLVAFAATLVDQAVWYAEQLRAEGVAAGAIAPAAAAHNRANSPVGSSSDSTAPSETTTQSMNTRMPTEQTSEVVEKDAEVPLPSSESLKPRPSDSTSDYGNALEQTVSRSVILLYVPEDIRVLHFMLADMLINSAAALKKAGLSGGALPQRQNRRGDFYESHAAQADGLEVIDESDAGGGMSSEAPSVTGRNPRDSLAQKENYFGFSRVSLAHLSNYYDGEDEENYHHDGDDDDDDDDDCDVELELDGQQKHHNHNNNGVIKRNAKKSVAKRDVLAMAQSACPAGSPTADTPCAEALLFNRAVELIQLSAKEELVEGRDAVTFNNKNNDPSAQPLALLNYERALTILLVLLRTHSAMRLMTSTHMKSKYGASVNPNTFQLNEGSLLQGLPEFLDRMDRDVVARLYLKTEAHYKRCLSYKN